MSKENMLKDIVIVGAGGMGRDTQWLIERINQNNPEYRILGYIDDGVETGTDICGYPVLGGMDFLTDYEQTLCVAFAIGNAGVRERLIQKCKDNRNLKYPNLIDPTAVLSERVWMGKGNILCVSVICTMNVTIGDFNLICNRAIIGHDDVLGNWNTLYPGTLLSGNVHLENRIEVGTGAQIIQGISISDDVIIGAGTTVIRNITTPGTYVGSPARRIAYEK